MVAQQEDQMTFEELMQLDRELSQENFSAMPEAGALDVAGKLKQVCSIYKKIRPVFNVVASFPLLPGSVKSAVKALMGVLDTVCV